MTTKVKQVPIRQRVSRWNLIRFQILTWCFLRNIQVTNADIEALVLLSILGRTKLTSFCEQLCTTELNISHKHKREDFKYIFNSKQSARNAMSKLHELGLIKREGKNKSNINLWLNPEMDIYTDQNLLINYQFLSIDTPES